MTQETEGRSPDRIVCAAIKAPGGLVYAGPRHAHCMWTVNAINRAIPPEKFTKKQSFDGWIEGFLTQHNEFKTRAEAWVIANEQNQIVERVGGDTRGGGCLYSENLY